MTAFLQYVIGGVATGSVYAIIALGFVLVYKGTDVFNFAQGNMMMLGAFLAYTALSSIGLALVPGIVVVLVFSAVLGVIIQLVFIRPLMGQSLLTLVMATIALSTIIEAVVSIIYGSSDRNLASTLPNTVVHLGGVRVSTLELIIMAISFGCMILFGVFFRFTRLGLQMRATAENAEAAALSGVNSQRVFRVTFAVAAALASLGGILLANLQLVSLSLGDIGLIAFPAAVVGGLTSIPGAVVGGIIIGVVESLTAGYVSTAAQDVFVYVILLLVLLVRPGGLFGGPAVVRV